MTLISPEYRSLQSQLHAEEESYGSASLAFADQIAKLIERREIRSMVDYGAGKQRLFHALQERLPSMPEYHPYDPALDAISASPEPAELVVCIDVLEHVEPEHLDAVLDDLARVVQGLGFFSIASYAAQRVLADGRNAHLIQQPMEWWLPRLWTRFRTPAVNALPDGFWVMTTLRDG